MEVMPYATLDLSGKRRVPSHCDRVKIFKENARPVSKKPPVSFLAQDTNQGLA
jgi:hypothetical protein